jgi:type II secretory pathway pseudopilin PulG
MLTTTRIPLHRDRIAFTLVELLLAMTLSSIIVGIALTLVAGVTRWDRRARQQASDGEQWSRLADELRTEIRRSADVTLPDRSQLVVSFDGGRRVTYRLTPTGCERRRDDPPSGGAHIEYFTIGGRFTWKLERRDSGRRPLVIVSLLLDEGVGERAIPPLAVFAALGADSSLNQPNMPELEVTQ